MKMKSASENTVENDKAFAEEEKLQQRFSQL